MLADEGRQSRDKWMRPRTGASGRQERFGKRQGVFQVGNHVSKDRHGEMQMSFSNESDVVLKKNKTTALQVTTPYYFFNL